jgi:hypothetical protein
MANQILVIGTSPNDGTGDTLRAGSDKTNDNFSEIYNLLGDGTSLSSGISATVSAVTLTAPTITGVVSGTQLSATITTLTGTTFNAGTLALAAGSITDSSGAISFGNENLTTTGTITATTSFLPSAQDSASLGTTSLQFSDLFLADGAVIGFGDDNEVTLTHVHNSGLLLSSTDQLQFGDSGTYIHQSADGVLDLVSDTEIEINATTIDINGIVEISGNLNVGGNLDVTGTVSFSDNNITDVGTLGVDSLFGDGDTDTSITFSGSNVITFKANNANQITITDGAVSPVTDSDVDLGTTSLRYKDVYVDSITVTGEVDGASLDISGSADIDADLLVGDDLTLNSDAAILGFGADTDVTLTHVADTGLLLNSTMALQFNDASQYINAPSATILDINATDEIELNATLLDVNANVEISGTAAIVGVATFTATPVFSADVTIEDDLFLDSDAAVLHLGEDGDVTLTHVADTGVLLNSTRQLQFGDSGTYIHQSADGVLDLVSDTELELNATTIDINGNVEISGTAAIVGVATFTATPVFSADVTIEDDLFLDSDAAVIHLGEDGDVTLTHVADTGLLLNSTMQLQFNDASQFINAPSATVLDINATDEIELNATLLDVNANINASGTYTGAGLMTTGGNIVIPNAGNIGSVSDTDAISISSGGVVTFNQIPIFSAGVNVSGGTLAGTLSTAAQGNITSLGTLTTLTVDSIIVNGSNIGHTSDTDAIAISSGGVVTFSQRDVHSAGITIQDGGSIGSASDLNAIAISSGGVVTFSQRDVHSAGITIQDGGSIGSASDLNAVTISSGGVVAVTATTASTNSTSGALTVAGGAGVAADLSVGDDLRLISDAAVLGFGADGDVTLTHVADTGLLLNGAMVIQFNDASQNIGAPTNAILDINATDEIELNATLVDVNANLDVSGTGVIAGALTSAAFTASGVLKTDDTTAATTTTDGSLQTDGGLSVAADAVIGDDLFMLSDAAVIAFGVNKEITLTHVHDVGLTLTHVTATDNLPIVLQLKSQEDVIVANEVIASIEFAAGDSDGTDGATVAAGIHAIAEGTFSASANATKLVFTTGVSETAASSATAKATLSSIGDFQVAGDLVIKDDGLIGSASDLDALSISSGGVVNFSARPTFAASLTIQDGGSLGSASDLNAVTISSGGVVAVTATTASTSATSGALTIAGGAGVAADLSVGDDLRLISDAAILGFGADGDVTLTHVADAGLLLNSTMKLQFNDASQFIHAPSATVLDIAATDEIELTATLIDVVGNFTVSGTIIGGGAITGGGLMTTGGNIVIPNDGYIGSAGDTDAIQIEADGDVVFTQDVAVGGNLTVSGTTTQVDTVTMEAANAVVFEGATADDYETTLTIIDPTADRTQRLINQSGYIPLLAALTTTAITSTPEELNKLDGATVVVGEINALDLGSTAIGTAIASKAVVLDSSKDYTGIRNLTISGEIDAATGDYSGAVDIAGATTTAAITASGIIKTDDSTAATSTTDGSLQTDGGLSVVLDAVIGDDLILLSDAAVIHFGADKDVTLTHVADTGLLLNGTSVIQFNDASQNIGAPSNAILDINATDEVEINATLIDINGNLDVSGTGVIAGAVTTAALTASGVLKTDDTTAATSTTDGSLQTDGGLSVVLDAVIGDDLIMISDASVVAFGADSEITLTHVADVGLTLTHVTATDNLPIVLQLKSSEDVVVANEVIGSIEFAAGDSDGTDGATVAAGIHAIAEGTFSASANATKLVFTTGVSETAASSATAKMTLSSAGLLTIADDFIIKDAGTIGSASDPDAIAIGSDGDVTLTQDLELQHDGVILSFGADDEVTLTHVHNDGLLLNADMQLQFRDSAINIRSDADGDLDINADDEIELNSTLIDINGNVDVSGTALITGVTTHGDDVVSDTDSTDDLGTTGVRWANLFVDAITATDQITATGFTGTLDGILGSGAAAAATTTTLASTTITASGIIKTDDTTAATSTTDGSLQTDGGLSVVLDAVIGDDIIMLSDAAVIHFGADSDVTLTHVADTGLLLNGTSVIQFNDASQNIGAPSATVLDINATDEIELNATLVDVNANLDVSGTGVIAGALTTAAITASGIIKTDDSTAATSTTDGSLQTDGGLSVVLDAVIGDDLLMLSDASVIHFGVNSEITATHVHNVGLTLTHTATGDNTPMVLQLKSEEDVIVADEVIASLEFAAGDSDGTDGATVAAGIHAIAEGTFSASANATKLVFTTGVSETAASSATAKMTLSSGGNLTIPGEIEVKNLGVITAAGTDFEAIELQNEVGDLLREDGGRVMSETSSSLSFGGGGLVGFDLDGPLTVTVLTATEDSAFNSTGALQISKGNTAQRPTGVTGMLRYNSTTTQFEGYSGSSAAWNSVGGSSIINDTSTSTNIFPLSASATSGTALQVYTSNTKYLYKPSDGSLQAPAMVSTNGLVVNSATVATSYTIPSGSNAMSIGTMTVSSGATVTVSSGSKWVVI